MKICAALLIACSLTGIAAADDEQVVTLERTCVELDAAPDQLGETDRKYALDLLRRALERADLFVVTDACKETYIVSHEKVDNGFAIHLKSSAGRRRMKTITLDDLYEKYVQMVTALIDAKEQATAAAQAPEAEPAAAVLQPDVDPLPTGDVQAIVPEYAPAESSVDEPKYKPSLWYASIGVQLTGGPAFRAGYRHRWSSTAFDLAFNARGSEGGTRATTLSAEVLHVKSFSGSTSGFIGGGLSAGSTSRGYEYGYDYYYGSGVHGELTTGVQFGHTRGIQMLVQLDITLPFYRMGNDMGGKEYGPMSVVSAGFGF